MVQVFCRACLDEPIGSSTRIALVVTKYSIFSLVRARRDDIFLNYGPPAPACSKVRFLLAVVFRRVFMPRLCTAVAMGRLVGSPLLKYSASSPHKIRIIESEAQTSRGAHVRCRFGNNCGGTPEFVQNQNSLADTHGQSKTMGRRYGGTGILTGTQ